jgi:hypothetical protein
VIRQLDKPCWVARRRIPGPNPFGELHFADAHSAALEINRVLKVDDMGEVCYLPLPVACWEIHCDTCPGSVTSDEFPEPGEVAIHAKDQAEARLWADEMGWLVLPDLSCYCKACRDVIEHPRPHLRSLPTGRPSDRKQC